VSRLNWRTPSDYHYTKDLSYKVWAWEFLRRNHDYRADWRSWGLDNDHRDDEGLARATSAAAKWGLLVPLDPMERGDRIARESPSDDFVWWRSELLSGNVFALNKNHASETVPALPEHIELIGFNMGKPVDQQIQQARRVLSRLRQARGDKPRPAKTKGHVKKWTTYLRALDAKGSGEALKEIAAVLLGDPLAATDVADTIAQAERLSDSGYRLIIALD
jgi:hypothetical protein